MDLPLTHHARARMRQRGIRADTVEHVLSYGSERHDHHGSVLVFLDKAARRRLQREARVPAAELDRLDDVYVVVAGNGAVTTVGHRFRRIRRR